MSEEKRLRREGGAESVPAPPQGEADARYDWQELIRSVESGRGSPLSTPIELDFPLLGKSVLVAGLPDVRSIEELNNMINLRDRNGDLDVDRWGATLTLASGERRRMTRNEIASCAWAEACVVSPKLSFKEWAMLQLVTGSAIDLICFKAMERSNAIPQSLLESKNA